VFENRGNDRCANKRQRSIGDGGMLRHAAWLGGNQVRVLDCVHEAEAP
jgi:hypothetical protein